MTDEYNKKTKVTDSLDSFLDSFLEEELDEFKSKTLIEDSNAKDIVKLKLGKIKEKKRLPSFSNIDKSKTDEMKLNKDKQAEDTFSNIHVKVGEEELEDYENDYYEYDNDDDEFSKLSQQAQAILDWEPEESKSSGGIILNEFIQSGWIGDLHLDKILTEAIITGASDVHISADQRVSMTRNGDIIRYDGYSIPDRNIMHMLVHDGILNQQQQQSLNLELEYNGSYTLMYGPFRGRRTRINVGFSFGKHILTFRIINDHIPSLKDLKVEQEIVDWGNYPNGLFLICGPTGTGKSTTLASVVHNIQLTNQKKIITIENPIEYIYPDDTTSLIVQREVGGDTRSFSNGLTSAMRQNPDIILLGEIRNTEETTELLRAAETGHLAISTMHTNSVATTINRIQNLFEGNEQRRVMSTLADTLRGLGNQVLVKDVEDGRFAVRELLTINNEIKDLILQGNVKGIREYQIKHKKTMEHKLAQATKEGKCSRENALKQTADPLLFNQLMGDR